MTYSITLIHAIAMLTFTITTTGMEAESPTAFTEKYPQAAFVKPLPNWDLQHAGHISNGWYEGNELPLDQENARTSGEVLPPLPLRTTCLPGACCNEDETQGCFAGNDGSCCDKKEPEALTSEDILPPEQLRDYRKAEIPPGFQQTGSCEPKPTCITPTKGPNKGGVRVTIQGDFMTSSIEDVDQVMICGAPCIELQVETFNNCTGPEAEKAENNDGPCWLDTLPTDENGQRTHQKHVYLYRKKTYSSNAAHILCLTTMTRYPDGRESFCETCALQPSEEDVMYRKVVENLPICMLHDVPEQSCNDDIITDDIPDDNELGEVSKGGSQEVSKGVETSDDTAPVVEFISLRSLEAPPIEEQQQEGYEGEASELNNVEDQNEKLNPEDESTEFERVCAKLCIPDLLEPDIFDDLNEKAGSILASSGIGTKNEVVHSEGSNDTEVKSSKGSNDTEVKSSEGNDNMELENNISDFVSFIAMEETLDPLNTENVSDSGSKRENALEDKKTEELEESEDNKAPKQIAIEGEETENAYDPGSIEKNALENIENDKALEQIPKEKENLQEDPTKAQEQCNEANSVHECRVTCGCPNEEDKALIESTKKEKEPPERLCISVCSHECTHDPDAMEKGVTTVPAPFGENDLGYIKVGTVNMDCGECEAGCTLCCPSCDYEDPINDEGMGMTSLDEVCSITGAVVSGGFKMLKDYSHCTCEIPCETVCASSFKISPDDAKRCQCEEEEEEEKTTKKPVDTQSNDENLPENDIQEEDPITKKKPTSPKEQIEELENEEERMDEVHEAIESDEHICMGGETKRANDYKNSAPEQVVEIEPSTGTCVPRETCDLTPTGTNNGGLECENVDGTECCSETKCRVADAIGYCGIKDKCIKKGLVPVSDTVYGGIATGCRNLPDDVMCCVTPEHIKCTTADSKQIQGRCTLKSTCSTTPEDNAEINGVDKDILTEKAPNPILCTSLSQTLTCCVDDIPCKSNIDPAVIGKCTVPQLCSQDNSIILTSDLEKGCNQKDTNLICCVLKEDEVEDKDENKCEESDLDEIKKTRDSCGKVIGGSKLRKEDGEIDYNSCLCEEVEECTSLNMDKLLSKEIETLVTPCNRDDATFDGGVVSQMCVETLDQPLLSCSSCFVANNRCTLGGRSDSEEEMQCSKCDVQKDLSKCTCKASCKEEDLNDVLLQMPGRDPLCSSPHARIMTNLMMKNSDFASCKCEIPCTEKDVGDGTKCFNPNEKISRCGSHPFKPPSSETDTLCAELCVYDEINKKCTNLESEHSNTIQKAKSGGSYEYVGGLIVGIPWCQVHCSPYLASRGVVTGLYHREGDTDKLDKSSCACERPCLLDDRNQVKDCESFGGMVDLSGIVLVKSDGVGDFTQCTCTELFVQGSDCVLEEEAEERLEGGNGDVAGKNENEDGDSSSSSSMKVRSGLYCDAIIEEPKGIYSVDSDFWKHFKLPIRVNRPGLSLNSDGKDAPLPKPWAKAHTDEGRTYYYNTKNGDVQWAHPLLPESWSSSETQHGDPVYWQRGTGKTKTNSEMTGIIKDDISLIKKSPFLCCVTSGGVFSRDKCSLVMAEECPEGSLRGNPDTCCKDSKVGYPAVKCSERKCYEDATRIKGLNAFSVEDVFLQSTEVVVSRESCPRGCETCGKAPNGGTECLSCVENGYSFQQGPFAPFGTCEVITRKKLFEGRTTRKEVNKECDLKSTSFDCPKECKCCLKKCEAPCSKVSSCTICASEKDYDLVSPRSEEEEEGQIKVGTCVKKGLTKDRIQAFSCLMTDGSETSSPNQAMPVMISVTQTCGETSMKNTISYFCESDEADEIAEEVVEPPPAGSTLPEKKGICCVEFGAGNFPEELEVEKRLLQASGLRSRKCIRTEQKICPSGYVKVQDHMAFLDKVINCDAHKTVFECYDFRDSCYWERGLVMNGACKPLENYCCTYMMKADEKYDCLRQTCDVDLSEEQCCMTPRPKSKSVSETVGAAIKKTFGLDGECSVGRCNLGKGTAFVGKVDQDNVDAFKKDGCCRFFIEKRAARQGYCSAANNSICEPVVTRCCVRESQQEGEPTTCSVLDVYNTESVNDACPPGFRVIEDPVLASTCCSFYPTDGVMMGPCGDIEQCIEGSSPMMTAINPDANGDGGGPLEKAPVGPPKVFSVAANNRGENEKEVVENGEVENEKEVVKNEGDVVEHGEVENESSSISSSKGGGDSTGGGASSKVTKKQKQQEGVIAPPEMF